MMRATASWSTGGVRQWLAGLGNPPPCAGGGGGGGAAERRQGDLHVRGGQLRRCHTLADAGATGSIGPDLDKVLAGKDEAFIKESIGTRARRSRTATRAASCRRTTATRFRRRRSMRS